MTLGPFRDYFAGRLPERLREIEQAWAEVRESGWAAQEVRVFHRLAHSLAGAGATFGYPAVTVAARRLEKALKPTVDDPAAAPAEAAVDELLSSLLRAAEQPAE